MKKYSRISKVIASFMLLTLATGCNDLSGLLGSGTSGFGQAWQGNYSAKTDEYTPPVDVEIEVPNAANDPFLLPENQNPNAEGFSAEVFNDWILTASFDSQNRATYKFLTNSSFKWHLTREGKEQVAEYSYNGENSFAGNNSITSMVYFQNRGKNPFYPTTNSYNKEPHVSRVNRFFFYRFTGKGGGIAALNNYLIAVDSYRKLVFAYAVPTSFKNVLGNQMPTSWGPVDTNTPIAGVNHPFYEFDPVGIVKSNGEVEIYDWFKAKLASGSYDPDLGDVNREVATYGKAGRSPYITSDSATAVELPRVDGKLTVELVSLENLDFYDGGAKWTKPNFMYEFTSSFANGAVKEKNRDVLNKHTAVGGWLKLPEQAKIIAVGESETFANSKQSYDISSTAKLFLDLDTDLREVDSPIWGGFENILSPSKPTLSLIFDREKDGGVWVINKDIPLNLLEGTTIEFDEDFSVSKTEGSKNLEIIVNRVKAGSDGASAGKIKITYRISWEELQAIEPIKGDLTITLDSLENINFTENNTPEFEYGFSVNVKDGNANKKATLASADEKENIAVAQSKTFVNATKVFAINGKFGLGFELKNNLKEVYGKLDVTLPIKSLLLADNLTDIKFEYNRQSKQWELAKDIKLDLPPATFKYSKDFVLQNGDMDKDFSIEVSHKKGSVRLNYKLSWQEQP